MNEPALNLILSRKSVRQFSDLPINKNKLELLVKAGMAAPSARNLQPWAFVIVTERETMDFLGDALPYAKMLKQANAAIVVCGDLNKVSPISKKDYWVQDCSAATQNILLAAEATGLGAVWTAAFPYEERMKPICECLNLPDSFLPLNIIPIGYPEGNDKPKDKWNPKNLFWEKFN
ncbi:MAG TPA: nitroreductase family protein [Bacteroidales bacterium]|jgi:nitroreductase|nr:nitroreductase family protein [Bacteroidales bacterium]MDD4234634.1 nitroreductase family protein [Bacteroidales bacterium]HXK80949.1 nitroreductase family protein [Bacteroidales bacterium]